MAAKKKTPPKPRTSKSGAKGKRSPKLAPNAVKRGLSAAEVALPLDHEDIAAVVDLVRKAGGAPLGAYREPLGGRPLLLASLPFGAVQPTPFQRDLSPTHAKRLAGAIEATAAFLDPLIVVRGEDGRFWTPNGRHRLAAAKVLGLKQITVLISPDESLSYRILALNTEKAHNLKDKSLEVVRMARNLAKREPTRTEASLAAEFEAAELLTLGLVYEENLRFGGGAYSPVLKKVDRLTTKPLPAALRERAGYASRLQEIDTEVKRIVAALQARGMKSPYLRSYVVARINPVRFHKVKAGDKKPVMPIAQALLRMVASAKKFDLGKVNLSDLAFVAAGAESAE
jgi:ParB family chromosome partitioning protein